ncbi:MAG: molecular chaperone TorD family protein [Eggerthellaceae bacterium]|nr:molecular chaperone TorD family protein [Eggerthellaceae bacterium]
MSQQEYAQMIQINEERAATYGFLSRLFRVEVDADFAGQLKEMHFPVKTGSDAIDEGNARMASYVAGMWDGSLTELAVDYFNVFYGVGVDSYSAAHPFESVYTSPKRLLMQEARDEVLEIYRQAGLEKQKDWREGEDHIALELEYLQVLSERIAQALEEGDENVAAALLQKQRSFLDEHVLVWTPMLTSDMRRFAKTDLYRGLADVTDGFLEADRQFVGEVLAS